MLEAKEQFKDLFFRLQAMRDFLVPLWIEWGEKNNKPVGVEGFGMCRFTSAFLSRELGPGWMFDGGSPLEFDLQSKKWIASKNGGGFRDAAGIWHAHHWVKNRETGVIVDITATQFGERSILIAPKDDVRFRSTMSTRTKQESLRDVRDRSRQWGNLWRNFCEEDQPEQEFPRQKIQ